MAEKTPDEFLRDCVQIEPLALEEEFIRMPADLAYWTQRYAEAQRKCMLAKLDLDETDARLTLMHRERMLAVGDKATEKIVDSAVTSDPAMHAARAAFIEAEYEKNKLNGTVDAIRTKKDMLVSLGAHIRAELQGDPALRAQARGHRELG
jgi:hypothetical protein